MYMLYSIVVIFSSYYNSLAVHTVFSVQINIIIPEKQNNQKQLGNFQTFKLTFFNVYKIFRTKKNIHEMYTRQNVHMKAA